MKKFIVFMFSVVLLGSCSSKKTLSEQIKYDWDINYNLSKDDVNERPYNLNKKLKNSSVQNQTEVQASLPTVKNNQDLLASNDKVEPSFLTNNHSYKKLPKLIQKERINNSYLEKAPILKNKEITKKKSRTKDKQNKILKLIGTSILIFFTIIIIAITGLLIALDGLFSRFSGFNGPGFIGLLLSTLFTYLSYKAIKKYIDKDW
tara:strand:+ start:99 stop:710 length:612 start_codon:yes stop_codon:yes gene_type:complete